MKHILLFKHLFFVYIFFILCFLHKADCIVDNSFVFILTKAKKLSSTSTNAKYELTFSLSFKKHKRAENFYLSALIPADSLHIISFTQEVFEKSGVDVKYDKPVAEVNDHCSTSIENEKYLEKINDVELEKFKIYKKPAKVVNAKNEVPKGYHFFNLSLKPMFKKEPTIQEDTYALKVTAEMSIRGLNANDTWIFGISEKKMNPTDKHHCTIYQTKLVKPFFDLLSLKHMRLDFCNSITNVEFLNLLYEFRKKVDVFIQSNKLFYGAHDVINTIDINLTKLKEVVMTDEIQIKIRVPIDICYTSNYFIDNNENPCLNLIRPNIFKCDYNSTSCEFLLHSTQKKEINNINLHLVKMKNPPIDYNTGDVWEINILTIDKSYITVTDEHLAILKNISNSKCSQEMISNIKKNITNAYWVYSHNAIVKMPQLVFFKLKPIKNNGILENPLMLQFIVDYEGTLEFKNCVFEFESIHNFTSIITESDDRVNPYNQQLYLPNAVFIPDKESKKKIKIEKSFVKKGDIIQVVINIEIYKNKEYWFYTLKCLNDEGKYIKEAEYQTVNPVENKEVYISDLYLSEEKTENKTFLFYMHIIALDEKELEVNITLPKDNPNVTMTEACQPEMIVSCYDLVYNKCSKKDRTITYHLNSYKPTNKHLSIYFPLHITNTSKPIQLSAVLNSLTDASRNITKNIEIDLETMKNNISRKICINNLIYKLKKYEKYYSHLFILFKAVNCNNISEPYITTNYNHESFYAKEENTITPFEKFNFQKAYIQKYPLKYNTISYELFKNNILAIFTFIIIDHSIMGDLKSQTSTFYEHIRHKIAIFPFNMYYIIQYLEKTVNIENCKLIKPTVTKCDIIKKIPQIETFVDAFEKVVIFAEEVEKNKPKRYMNSEIDFLLLTNKGNIKILKSNSEKYKNPQSDRIKNISKIYAVSFENGTDIRSYSKNFNISLQNTQDPLQYHIPKMKKSLFFISFYEYLIDIKLLYHYMVATVQDFIFLHTKLYKSSWVLLGICRNNISQIKKKQRILHIYYVNQKVYTLSYESFEEDLLRVYNNSSVDSFQDMCNIFTQLKLLHYNVSKESASENKIK